MKEHKDGFNRDNIDSLTADNGFHILPGKITSKFITHQCDEYEDTLPVALQLLFCGGRYVAAEIDGALGKAHCIRNALIARDQFPVDNLSRINVPDFGAAPQETNDNTILINMNMILVLDYCTNDCT